MKVLKEQIRSIVITRIPFAIINSKGKMKCPFISSSASEQVVNALVNGIYEELSKLHQPTVISAVCSCVRKHRPYEHNLNECRICEKPIWQTVL